MEHGEGLTFDVKCRVGTITIDRPSHRNALHQEGMETLVRFIDGMDFDVQIVLLAGAGQDAFCSGRDLKECAQIDRSSTHSHQPMRGDTRNCFEAVWECRKPTIVAINGAVVGGGFELLLAGDQHLAASHVRFSLPESKRGMGANFGSNLLAWMVPPTVYLEWDYLGDVFDVHETQRWGLLNRIVSGDRLVDLAYAWAHELKSRAPLTLRRPRTSTPAALRAGFAPDPYEGEDRVEGVAAFAEKREPVWRGR